MNGPVKMYPLKEIVRHGGPIQLPTCMYRMKNLHSTAVRPVTDITEQNNTGLTGMAALEQRQERILKQLEELKSQMLSIRQTLKQSGSTSSCSLASSPTTRVVKNVDVKNIPEVVINASPLHPPYSLLLLKKLWANSVDLCVQSYTHSSVTKLPENAQNLCDALTQTQPCNGVPKVFIRLIWKDVGVNQLELLISTTPILGECNFLRYIARLTSLLGYDESNFEIDGMLDISYLILHSKTKTERAQLLQQVNKRLGKSAYLFGESICIADVALYSAIKQVAASETNAGLSKWMQRCES